MSNTTMTATFSPLTIEPGMLTMCTWHVTRGSETLVAGVRGETLCFSVDRGFTASGDGHSRKPAEYDLTLATGAEQANETIRSSPTPELAEHLGLVDGLQLRVVATSTGLQVTDSDEVTNLHLSIIGTAGPMAFAT
jgi:hypothetical protein